MPKLSNHALIERLLDQYEPRVRNAFLESVREIKNTAQLSRIISALETGDVDGAIAALKLEPAALRVLDAMIREAYDIGGYSTVSGFPALVDRQGAAVVVRWYVRNPRAERWLADMSSSLVTEILDDQRSMVRTVLREGLERGQNPRTTALDLVGRINRKTGDREGGVIGLTSRQERTVANMRAKLASGDPSKMREVLGLKLRDRRYDASILRAIGDGKPVPDSVIGTMAQRYTARALKYRGDLIGETETMQAIHAAKHEAMRQGLEATGYTEADIERVWRTAGDGKVRDTHASMNGQKVTGLEAPFVSPSGARLKHPGDTSLGAPVEEIIRCRCDDEINLLYGRGVA